MEYQDNMVLDTIFARSSIRAYTDEPLTSEELKTLADVALAAPTARNAQAQRFYFITNKELIDEWEGFVADEIMQTGNDSSKSKLIDRKGRVFYNAPLVVAIAIDKSNHFSECDSGIAIGTLALAAQSMGLSSVILGLPRLGFNKHGNYLRERLGIDSGLDFAIAIAIGHAATDKAPHDSDSTHVIFIKD